MSLIALISEEKHLYDTVTNSLSKQHDEMDFESKWTKTVDEAMEVLNYDLPEIVLLDCSMGTEQLEKLMERVIADSWLHSFGIIGLFDQSKIKEKELFKLLKNINLLALLEKRKVGSDLLRILSIIDKNRQIIFQSSIADKLATNLTGSFEIENHPVAVSVYAGLAATFLATKGWINMDKKTNLQMALYELILNGVEHGNCGITWDEKNALLMEGGNILDLIAKKMIDPEIKKRKVVLDWQVKDDKTLFRIQDEGAGFDVKKYLEKMKNADPMALHGRGILLARELGCKIQYNQKGNAVTVAIKHDSESHRQTPIGFKNEEVLETKKGDIVFQEGEPGDFLYYISGGQYSVFHHARKVGIITPADIFMGEMSFLLNKKRNATVRCDSRGKLVKISRKSFVSVAKQYPHYGIFLAKQLARKLARSNRSHALFQEKLFQ